MADAVENAEGGFWRAAVAPETSHPGAANPTLVEACEGCATEFIVGARFCHVCGAARPGLSVRPTHRIRLLTWTRHLEFQAVKERLGLPAISLIAFLFGVICVLAAISVSFIFAANSVLDWQAIQVWRIEWLLGAAAMFLASIVLKRS